MKIPRHIVWSFDKAENLDLSEPENKKWWIKQVLMNGRMEDIQSLDLDEVEKILPELYLPRPIRKLWSDYFAKRKTADSISEYDRSTGVYMNPESSNSASFPVFIDGTSSAMPSGFNESTAPSDNLASIQRNWILVSPANVQDHAGPPAERGQASPIPRQPA